LYFTIKRAYFVGNDKLNFANGYKYFIYFYFLKIKNRYKKKIYFKITLTHTITLTCTHFWLSESENISMK